MTWSVNCSAATTNASRLWRNKDQQHPSQQPTPEKFPVSNRHLREFCAPSSILHDCKGSATAIPNDGDESHQPLKERVSIKPMDFVNYLLDGLSLYLRNLRHPSTIPGTGTRSKIYAFGVLPGMVAFLVFCQWTITLVILLSSYTVLGKKAFQLFLKDEILLFDTTDTVDSNGTEEALRQLADIRPKSKPSFSYYIANLLLVMSTVTYERDDSLVRSASLIMSNIENNDERAKAAALLEASEHTIDAKAQLLGMRFMGISELKSLGGPYAGLFYNDDTMILVYKGTSVLAFNEYLIDATIQRVDAQEFLYGEVHKGFYESLFPDPTPLDSYERATYDRANPFHSIMQTIFETARKLKNKTGKPVNLWMTGHSLGGALAAMTMARLQMPLRASDPLFKDSDPTTVKTHKKDGTPRTVLQEMLSRFEFASSSAMVASSSTSTLSSSTSGSTSSGSTFPFSFLHHHHHHHQHQHHHQTHDHPHDHQSSSFNTTKDSYNLDDVLILRDCYSFASPKLGDTAFSQEFDRNHTQFLEQSIFKPTYYRVIVDKDIIPRMPPGCSTDPDDKRERMFPCVRCAKKDEVSEAAPLQQGHEQQSSTQTVSYGSVDRKPKESTAAATTPHLHSLLDYRHIGQLVSLHNMIIAPTVKPSEFQTNLCAGVLRTDESVKEVLQQIELALSFASTSGNESSSSSVAGTSSNPGFSAVKTAQEMEKAKERHDLDELSRLRAPCDAEKFLLTFPNVMSHSPVIYQRNLVRSRYYFDSFPGTEMLEKVIAAQKSSTSSMAKVGITRTVVVVSEDHDLQQQNVEQKDLQIEHGQQGGEGQKLQRPTEGMFVFRDSGVVIDMDAGQI